MYAGRVAGRVCEAHKQGRSTGGRRWLCGRAASWHAQRAIAFPEGSSLEHFSYVWTLDS